MIVPGENCTTSRDFGAGWASESTRTVASSSGLGVVIWDERNCMLRSLVEPDCGEGPLSAQRGPECPEREGRDEKDRCQSTERVPRRSISERIEKGRGERHVSDGDRKQSETR